MTRTTSVLPFYFHGCLFFPFKSSTMLQTSFNRQIALLCNTAGTVILCLFLLLLGDLTNTEFDNLVQGSREVTMFINSSNVMREQYHYNIIHQPRYINKCWLLIRSTNKKAEWIPMHFNVDR